MMWFLNKAYEEKRLCFRAFTLQQGKDILKPTIAELGRHIPHEDVATIFGIDPSSVKAIMAHDTRGSYGSPAMVKVTYEDVDREISNLGWKSHKMIEGGK